MRFKIRVEAAWTTDPLVRPAGGAWSQLSDVCPGIRNLSIKRGTQVITSQVEAGTATFQADNANRKLDPSNVASPLYPNVKPRKRIRIIATITVTDADVYTDVYTDIYPSAPGDYEIVLFTGFAERWPIEWGLVEGWATVTASDLLGLLATVKLPQSVLDVVTRGLSPVSYWPMSETVFSGEAADVVGHNPGLYIGPVQAGGQLSPYDPRPCPNFPKPGVTNDANNVPCSMTVPMTPADTFTLSTWFKWNPGPGAADEPILLLASQGVPDAAQIASGPSFAATPALFVYIRPATSPDGYYLLRCRINDGTNKVVVTSLVSYPILDGQPHQLVWTVDGATKTITVQVDGGTATVLTDGGFTGFDPLTSVDVSAAIAACDHVSAGWGIVWLNSELTNPNTGIVGQLAYWDRVLSFTEGRSLNEAGMAAWSGDTTGGRLNRVLDIVGVDAGDRDIDVGTQICGPTILGGQTVLAYLRKLSATEQNACFVNGDGKIRFPNRTPASPTVVQVFSDDPLGDSAAPYAPVKPDYSYDRIINTVTADTEIGQSEPSVNAASVTAYGELFGATGGRIETMHRDGADAKATADLLTTRHGTPKTFIPTLEVTSASSLVSRHALSGVEIGDAVTAKARPAGGGAPIVTSALVEHIEHKFPVPTEWRAVYSLIEF